METWKKINEIKIMGGKIFKINKDVLDDNVMDFQILKMKIRKR